MKMIKKIFNEEREMVGVLMQGENNYVGVYDTEANVNIYDSFAKELGEDGFLLEELSSERVGRNMVISAKLNKETTAMNLKLIPELEFINDKTKESFKVDTAEEVIRINNTILFRHRPDIEDKLENIFKNGSVTIRLIHHMIDEYTAPSGLKAKEINVEGYYHINEYFNSDMSKNDTVYIFGYDVREVMKEYRHRQKLNSDKKYTINNSVNLDSTTKHVFNEISNRINESLKRGE